MSPQRFALLATLCGTLVLAGWVAAGLAGIGSTGIENSGEPIEDNQATSVAAQAEHVEGPRATSMGDAATADPATADLASTQFALASVTRSASAPVDPNTPRATVLVADDSAAEEPVVEASSSPPPETRVQLVSLFTAGTANEYVKLPVRPVAVLDECLVISICIDEYLWSLYERTPKVDTNKVTERIKVTVKHKGKTRTVTKTITKYVLGDFTWKDPIAAKKVGMSLKDYVIGGMDRSFKVKLFRAVRAMDEAGLMPGITSAFRDDYRQAIAAGNKAASDSSYHGGSRRGGYGHGLAADLVSVKGDTRMQRYASSQDLWKWIDANEQELGIGRPYLDRDPPHVAPIDGKEYAVKRGWAKVKLAGSAPSKRPRLAVRDDHGTTKRATKAKSSRVGSI